MEFPRRTTLKALGALTIGGAFASSTAVAEPGVTVSETDGGTQVSESGGTDQYSLVLNTQPTAEVVITAEVENGQITIETDETDETDKIDLTFTPTNYNDWQTVTVSAVQDEEVEGTVVDRVVHSADSDDPDYEDVDVPAVAVSIVDNDLAAEIEGTITSIDLENDTMTANGIDVDISDATFSCPNNPDLGSGELKEPSFAGREAPGFVGGTFKGHVKSVNDAEKVLGTDIFVEVAENVIFGAVTENTIPEGGSIGDDGTTLKVQGVEILPIGDTRQPFHSSMHGLIADHGTIERGSPVATEGYFADGTLYAHTVEIMRAEAPGDQTSVMRARCDESGKLKVRGASSTYPETVAIYNNDNGNNLGTAEAVQEAGSTVGMYRFREPVESLPSGSCPHEIRVENTNGSRTVAPVEVEE